MQLRHQTVLITGGSAGIGLALARYLIAAKNTVLICGRSAENLAEAKSHIPDLHTFQCDVSVANERLALLAWINTHHAQCNVLVNNAAIAHPTDFRSDPDMLSKAALEIATNLMAPIALTKLFLPLLEEKKQSAVVNITTGLVYTPRAVYPVYNATKAALHSFTQVLRKQLNGSSIKIIEVMMPVVATSWHKGDVPKIAISPAEAIQKMIGPIEKGRQEVRVGAVNMLYALSRIAPRFASRIINKMP